MTSTVFIAAIVLVFLAVFLLLEAIFVWWNSTKGPEARRIARRLRMMSAGGHVDAETSSILKRRILSDIPEFERLLLQLPRIQSFDRFLVQSGLNVTVGGFVGLSIALFLVGVAGTVLLGVHVGIALALGAVLAALPSQYLLLKRAQRITRFEQLMPDALDLIGRALRAGHSFPSALQMAGMEMPSPIGEELRQTFDEVNFGIAVPTALENLVTRVPSTDLKFFAIAVMIQRETGGNLSEVLQNISAIIRERLKLLGKVRALSAEGRMSAWILGLLPFFTAALLWLLNPEMMSLLWTEPTGRRLVIIGLIMMCIGGVTMRKIIRIHI